MAWSKVLFPLSIAILSLFPPVSLASEENISSERPQDLVEWKDCEAPLIDVNFQCGYFEIPLDWHDPSAGKGRLAFTKYKASGPSKGTIFIDPGFPFAATPGLSATTWLFSIGYRLHNRTGGEYDIIVWDVRGRGLHTIPGALTCFDSPESLSTFWWRNSQEMGTVVPWNNHTDANWRSDYEQVITYQKKYEELVHQCLQREYASLLRYVGTAATARDVVAMSDYFDGIGAPILFWGMSYGTLTGNYLIDMFPERIGRVILDGPVDPRRMIEQSSISVWEDDIDSANAVLTAFGDRCAQQGFQGCQLINGPIPFEYGSDVFNYAKTILAFIRTTFAGWRAVFGFDLLLNIRVEDFLTTVYNTTMSGDSRIRYYNEVGQVDELTRLVDESSGPGAMPIFCGDVLDDFDANPDIKQAAVERIMTNIRSVPLVMAQLFPSSRYLCHLWPIRAVERHSGGWERKPSRPVLVLGYQLNPLNPFEDAQAVARLLSDGAIFVEQEGLGVPFFGHSRCMSLIISSYLQNGTIPSDSERLCTVYGGENVVVSQHGSS
ncbi:hypothetical protein A0H81_10224 [Grifola frondosa]|uniref:Peptidase S33 tripeptidyl aminopeptidase-like C-terminal domain-containing protein n=1 Tax=Grifola frondosa TaxID=5627 RepID=A0A1C7LZ12_GRIFR|nr:hypothetical protein A0H81_10224 [Grifola frondosa]